MKVKAIKIGWSALYFVVGMLLLFGMWDMVSRITKNALPSPLATWGIFKEVMTNPFQNDPDYKGIGTKLLSSLTRVAIGFGLGSLIAIPLGFVLGSSRIMMNIINPIVQILRPVSPLAWFPTGVGYFSGFTQSKHLYDLHLFLVAHTHQYFVWRIEHTAGS
jgi:nitrate/nitrite transport system permease protein